MFVDFELKGLSSLLMHADDVESSDMLTEWRKDPDNKRSSTAGDDRSPAWTWMTYLYKDDSHVVVPSQNVMVCLRTAATRVILKKQTTYKEISQSGLLPETEFLDLYANEKKVKMSDVIAMRDLPFADQAKEAKRLGFTLFVKRATIKKAKHVRVRPRFDDWTIRGRFEVLLPELTKEALTTIFDLAGRVGLGDWRPGGKTPGPYGRFQAALKFVKG